VDRVKKVLSALIASRNIHDFANGSPPGWRVHRLSGGRDGVWSDATAACRDYHCLDVYRSEGSV